MLLKQTLRSEVRRRKAQFSPDELVAKSREVIARLEANALFQSAQTVMLYWSLPDEVCTHQLIARILGAQKLFRV